MVHLRPLTLEECLLVREWRNDPATLPMLRTGAKTVEEQTAFYHDVILNQQADHRYWAIERDFDGVFLGMGGLTYLSRVPGEAEISLLLGPLYRRSGLGVRACIEIVDEAHRMGLVAVMGECYRTGPVGFWQRLTSLSPYGAGAWFGDSYRFWWLVR